MYEANAQEYLVTMKKEGKLFTVALDDEDIAAILNSGEYEIIAEKLLPSRVDGTEVYV